MRPPERHRRTLAFATLSVGVGAYALLQSLVMPVLNELAVRLDTTANSATWILTGYLLSASIFTPIMGRLGDIYGKKLLYVLALIALSVGSAIAALATSLPVMLAGRVVQGIGGGVLPLAFGIIRDIYPRPKVAGAVGLIAALSAAGAGVGLVLAGPISATLGESWLFWVPMLVVIATLCVAVFVVPRSTVRDPSSVNWVAAALLAGWLTALLLALSEGPRTGWLSPWPITLFIVAIVLTAAWIVREIRSPTPLIDMTIMRLRSVWSANIVALLMGVGMYAAFGFVPQFLQTPPSAGYGFGASVTDAGLMLLPLSVGMFILGLFSGRLSDLIGARALIVIGSSISSIGYFLIAFCHSTELGIYLAMSLVGIGLGLAFSAMSNVVVGAVPQGSSGMASGMNANIRTIGGAVGAATMASIVTAKSGIPTESQYVVGFAVLGIAVAIGSLAALAIPSTSVNKEDETQTRLQDAKMNSSRT
ncbi:MFS transporter [Rhodococcus sp. NPDC056743]|uniref:MFS transporter n=1 Tax=Rhodococcus sp. NPDC056743 TaxID=3345934 RepID=UPI00366AB213